MTDGVDSTSDADFAEARAKLLHSGLACYLIQVNTEESVEDRLLKDCRDDGRPSLSAKQLQRYRRIFAIFTEQCEAMLFGPWKSKRAVCFESCSKHEVSVLRFREAGGIMSGARERWMAEEKLTGR